MSAMKTREDVIHSFTYHPPKPGKRPRYRLVNEKIMEAALVICDNAPDSPSRDLALREMKDALLHAFEAMACTAEQE